MLADNSFYVQIINDEIITYYEIVPMDKYFIIALNGIDIAHMSINGSYEQTDGKILPEQVLQSIGRQISNVFSSYFSPGNQQ
jgi:hypothetical protein